jgi:uncharacterized membrane protein YcaP (DUF421 family)
MHDVLEDLLGLSMKSEQLGFFHMGMRAFVTYIALIAIVRIGKKRFLGRATAFDVVLAIMVGAIAARATTGGAPYFPSLLAILVFVFIHWAFSGLARGSQTFSSLIKGNPTVLIRDGEIDERNLKDAHMSRDDLDEDLREKGIPDPADVAEARLERSGRLSVIKSPQPGPGSSLRAPA